jgi:FkbM family methyltransferase
MEIFFGTKEKHFLVTEICKEKFMNNEIITIPADDNLRVHHFEEPAFNEFKKIFIVDFSNNNIHEIDHTKIVKINTKTHEIETHFLDDPNVNIKLVNMQNKLKLLFGKWSEELPEQKMATRFFTGREKVLEIGGNIGRNSLIIGHILCSYTQNNNYVVLESNDKIAFQLLQNRNLNKMCFHIENSALSKRQLIQHGWNTRPHESEIIPDDCQKINCITWEELNKKYNINFDTLVIDCEGAFYYILMDMPEILENINLIIMENDYYDPQHKLFVDSILKKYNFYVEYREHGGTGFNLQVFYKFYEVWKKK